MRIREINLQYDNPTLISSCSCFRTRRYGELGPPLCVDACTIGEDDARDGVANLCYALGEEARARDAPYKLASDAREQEGERN